jgi:hypothetical protein
VATVDIGLIGRDSELSQLIHLVDPPPTAGQVQVLLGEPGMGKTVLLIEVIRRAESAGLRVLTVTGRESERDLAFAGLHQLLRPLLDRVPTLPDRQAQALLSAFALATDPVPPDALLTGIAVLTLLSGLAEHGPVLVATDDAQWLDRASLDTLAFVARRLESEPLGVLLAARGNAAPAGFTTDFPELILPPLGRPEAGRLLDEQPHPPRGRAREQVLEQATGNPLALIELTRAIAADPAAGRRWSAEPFPLTDRLTAVMAAQFGVLPRSARAALMLARGPAAARSAQPAARPRNARRQRRGPVRAAMGMRRQRPVGRSARRRPAGTRRRRRVPDGNHRSLRRPVHRLGVRAARRPGAGTAAAGQRLDACRRDGVPLRCRPSPPLRRKGGLGPRAGS